MKGATCETNDRVRLGLLRRRRLLQRRLPGRLRLLQPDGPRGHLLADRRGRARPARRLHGPGRRRAAARRAPATASAAARSTPRDTECIAPDLLGQRGCNTAGHLRRARHLPRAGRPGLPPVPLRRRRLHQDLQDRRRLRHRASPASTAPAGPSRTASPAPAASECQSNHCVDGVCCDSACTGACRSCALPRRSGRCTPIAAGQRRSARRVRGRWRRRPAGRTASATAAAAARSTPVGTLCADETCTANVYKPPSTCNATGQCVAPDSLPCSPYVCNGTRCFNACTTDAQCLTPNTCDGNSCGMKDARRHRARRADECQSNFCAQGVCCDKACAGACKSCALAARSAPARTSPPARTIPPASARTQDAVDAAARTASARRAPARSTRRARPARPRPARRRRNRSRPLSTCDGAGTCVTPARAAPASRTAAARTPARPSCTADADCPSPAVCIERLVRPQAERRGLRQQGRVPLELLRAGRLLPDAPAPASASRARCRRRAGTCSNVAERRQPTQSPLRRSGRAPAAAPTGVCDGNGACRLYDASTSCAAPSCPAEPVDADDAAAPATASASASRRRRIACAPYVCNGATACQAACTGDADCLPPNICDPQTNRCGNKKRLGQPCAGDQPTA